MRRAARVDDNQPALVKELRAYGVSVQPLHTVGQGCPDILCGFQGLNWLFEIKDPAKVPSKRKLTADQKDWHLMWSGQVHVIESADDAMAIMNASGGSVALVELRGVIS